ncbi:MAG: methylmalonyl-CoA mutase [Lentimonas sp.]|jgi:methylmalonyl-CoA mutase
MSKKLFESFSSLSYDDWKSAVEKELKGNSFEDTLEVNDPIENIKFSKFSDTSTDSDSELSYHRAHKSQNNDWGIRHTIIVKDEKVANKEAIHVLELGCSSLVFQLAKRNISFGLLFEHIELNYIESRIIAIDTEQQEELAKEWSKYSIKNLICKVDDFNSDFTFHYKKPNTALLINAYGVHQSGANASQELAFALSVGNEYLHRLIDAGNKIDDIAPYLKFEFGIGSNYFVEISKFRVFRKLWSNIVAQYKPIENCTHAAHVTAKTGFINKSIKDPYTNLLRQTTEAMSAVIGGVNEIEIQPYDKYSTVKNRDLSLRMAVNISHILKEESYLSHVVDPMGGSHSIQNIGEALAKQTWDLFLNLEKAGGISSPEAKKLLHEKIDQTKKVRIDQHLEKKKTLIGVNKFDNPKPEPGEWLNLPEYKGHEALILEKL